MAKTDFKVWIAEHLALAGILGLLVMFGLGYLVLIGPELARIRAANRVQALEDEQRAKLGYLHDLETLETNFEQIPQKDVKDIVSMIPPEEDVPGLLVTIEALAAQSDISVTSISFAVSDKPEARTGAGAIEGVKAVNMSIGLANADYERFKGFLKSLERNLRLFDVQQVSINPAGASYALSIRTYFSYD